MNIAGRAQKDISFARNWRHQKVENAPSRTQPSSHFISQHFASETNEGHRFVCVFQQKIKALIKTIAGRLPAHFEAGAEKWQRQAKHRQQTLRNNGRALFGEARCLRQLGGPDHMLSQSLCKNQQHSSCATSTESKHHAGCSFLAASAISLLGMTLLAAALLVHFLLLTSVARNGECKKTRFFFRRPPFLFVCRLHYPHRTHTHTPCGNELRCARVHARDSRLDASGRKRLMGLARQIKQVLGPVHICRITSHANFESFYELKCTFLVYYLSLFIGVCF